MTPPDAANASVAPTPALELQFDERLNGGYAYPRTSIDQTSGRIAVLQDEQHIDLWQRVVYESADWSLLLCLIAAPILLHKAWRIFRTPRARGRLTCRRCTYDLGPVGSETADRCPECGSLTSRYKPVLGRSTASRLLGPLFLLALVVSFTAGTCLLTLVPAGLFASGRRWPPLIHAYLPAWAVRAHREPHAAETARIDIWSIPEHRLLRTIRQSDLPGSWLTSGFVGDMRLLPGGEFLALTMLEDGITTRLIRVSSGEIIWSSHSPTASPIRLAGIAGASRDGTRIYFWRFNCPSPPGGDIEVDEVTIAGGAVRPLGSVHITHDADMWGVMRVYAADGPSGPHWAVVEQTSTGGMVYFPGHPPLTSIRFHTIAVGVRAIRPGGEPAVILPLSGNTATAASAWQVPLDGSDVKTIPLDALSVTGTNLNFTPTSGAGSTFATGRSLITSIHPVLPSDRWTVVLADDRKPPIIQLPYGGGTPGRIRGFLQVWEIAPPSTPAPAPVRGDK